VSESELIVQEYLSVAQRRVVMKVFSTLQMENVISILIKKLYITFTHSWVFFLELICVIARESEVSYWCTR